MLEAIDVALLLRGLGAVERLPTTVERVARFIPVPMVLETR